MSDRFTHQIIFVNIASLYRVDESEHRLPFAAKTNLADDGSIEYGAIGDEAIIHDDGLSEILKRGLASIKERPDLEAIGNVADITFASNNETELLRLRVAYARMFLDWAKCNRTEYIELSPRRALIANFTSGPKPLVKRSEMAGVVTTPIGWRCVTEGSTTTLYICHEVFFTQPAMFDTLLRDPEDRVRYVTREELATTDGGRREGQTRDGHALRHDMFERKFIRPL